MAVNCKLPELALLVRVRKPSFIVGSPLIRSGMLEPDQWASIDGIANVRTGPQGSRQFALPAVGSRTRGWRPMKLTDSIDCTGGLRPAIVWTAEAAALVTRSRPGFGFHRTTEDWFVNSTSLAEIEPRRFPVAPSAPIGKWRASTEVIVGHLEALYADRVGSLLLCATDRKKSRETGRLSLPKHRATFLF